MTYIQSVEQAVSVACDQVVGALSSWSNLADLVGFMQLAFGDYFRVTYNAAVVPLLRRVSWIERPGIIERVNGCAFDREVSALNSAAHIDREWGSCKGASHVTPWGSCGSPDLNIIFSAAQDSGDFMANLVNLVQTINSQGYPAGYGTWPTTNADWHQHTAWVAVTYGALLERALADAAFYASYQV